jgi:hypothetical protein
MCGSNKHSGSCWCHIPLLSRYANAFGYAGSSDSKELAIGSIRAADRLVPVEASLIRNRIEE